MSLMNTAQKSSVTSSKQKADIHHEDYPPWSSWLYLWNSGIVRICMNKHFSKGAVFCYGWKFGTDWNLSSVETLESCKPRTQLPYLLISSSPPEQTSLVLSVSKLLRTIDSKPFTIHWLSKGSGFWQPNC